MGAVMNPMGENVQKYAELFLLVRSTGGGGLDCPRQSKIDLGNRSTLSRTIRRIVEGLCSILTSFGPSVAHSAHHLPKASLQGGCA
jgi:hypothetical protein